MLPMAATTRALFLSCFHGGSDASGHLALRSRYPSMPRRPRSAVVAGEGAGSSGGGGDLEAAEEEEEKVAVFAVSGMTCAACAGSVEKAVKRLPGIHEAAVDVLGGRAQVAFYPASVSVSIGVLCGLRHSQLLGLHLLSSSFSDAVFIRSIDSGRHILRGNKMNFDACVLFFFEVR